MIQDADARAGGAAGAEKPVPLWVAVGIMAAIVVGGGGFIYYYLFRPPPRNSIKVITPAPNDPRIARSGGDAPSGNPAIDPLLVARESEMGDGVHALPTGGTMVKAGDAYVKAFDHPDNAAPTMSFGFFTLNDAQWEHGYLSNAVRRLLGDAEYARSLSVTADQLEKLEDLPPAPALRWPDDVRRRFVEMYGKWRGAAEKDRAAAAGTLVRELHAYAKDRRAADERAMGERVRRIRSVLTAKQMEAMNPIPKWDLPASRPVGR